MFKDMNIVRNEKVALIKEMGSMKDVGAVYEVANITETAVVLRDARSKIAVGAVNIDKFNQYFKKLDTVKGWTEWHGVVNPNGDIVAFYRTNFKKVQVKLPNGIRAESCCDRRDEFDLTFGYSLAYARCQDKDMKKFVEDQESVLKYYRSQIIENKNYIKKLLRISDGKEE